MKITMKDCRMDTFSVSGAGGQRRDHTNTGVRITHIASGATGIGSESRKQIDNKRTAFVRMANSPTFRDWASAQTGLGESMPVVQETQVIRTYNLVDNRVVDHRTKKKSALVDSILNGDLDLVR